MAFVAKKSLFDIPLLGFAMSYYRCVSIDRGDRVQAIKKLNEDCFDRLSKKIYLNICQYLNFSKIRIHFQKN